MTTVSYTQLYTHTGGVCGAVPDYHGESYSVIYTYWGSTWSCP